MRNMTFICPYLGNFIIPIDALMFFQRGRCTTNQGIISRKWPLKFEFDASCHAPSDEFRIQPWIHLIIQGGSPGEKNLRQVEEKEKYVFFGERFRVQVISKSSCDSRKEE